MHFLSKIGMLMVNKMKNKNQSTVAQLMISWFLTHQRDFPWRGTLDSYAVWISEIMLQQTRIETVIQYYQKFMSVFPSVDQLAQADLKKVYGIWAGLGYYQRAANLWKASKIIQSTYQSKVPNEYVTLRKLPGIGDYTASAILSIAFNQPFPAVDGNVLRVVARMQGWRDNVLEKQTVDKTKTYLHSIIPNNQCSEFTQSWMELGETLCSKQAPLCLKCPLVSQCYAYQQQVTDQLPIRVKILQRTIENRAVFLIQPSPNELVITQKKTGLLAQLWELPNVECHPDFSTDSPPEQYTYPGMKQVFSYVASLKHDFTHKRWQLHVYQGKINPNTQLSPDWHIIEMNELVHYPMSTAFKKVLRLHNPNKIG